MPFRVGETIFFGRGRHAWSTMTALLELGRKENRTSFQKLPFYVGERALFPQKYESGLQTRGPTWFSWIQTWGQLGASVHRMASFRQGFRGRCSGEENCSPKLSGRIAAEGRTFRMGSAPSVGPASVGPGSVSPSSVNPGSVSPGSVIPGSVSPGSVGPSSVSPSQGSVGSGSVSRLLAQALLAPAL